LVTEIASNQSLKRGVSEDYLATREFRKIATRQNREQLLQCLFAVCAADDSISVREEEEVRQVANELGLTHSEYLAARSTFSEKREVLRGLPRNRPLGAVTE
jgi:uncharacterized tellurite resistance protein B-like protein